MWNVAERDARAKCITRGNIQGRDGDTARRTDGLGIQPK